MTIFLPNMAQPPASLGQRVYWNPFDNNGVTLSNGDWTAAYPAGGGTASGVRATRSHATTGKYYYECTCDHANASGQNSPGIGIANVSWNFNELAANFWGICSSGSTLNNGTATGNSTTFTDGDVIGVALDLAAGNVWFAKNNVWLASGNPSAGTGPTCTGITGTIYPAAYVFGASTGTATKISARFLSSAWSYTPPTGFGAW